MKGIIALDIDGTVTAEAHEVSQEVISYLTQLEKQQWQFIFITGRTFQWAYSSLHALNMPYYLAVQNGAIVFEMPARKIISTCYVDASLLAQMTLIANSLNTDFIIYTGYENNDICYYRLKNFTQSHLTYLLDRAKALHENWQTVEDFEGLELPSIASLKFIDKEETILKVIDKVEKELHLHIPLNRDPVNNEYFVAQATNPQATKGNALKSFSDKFNKNLPIIAAGDDYNDLSMLQQADVKIVMGDAPGPLLMEADIIAPPISQLGIIQGLKHAIALVNFKEV